MYADGHALLLIKKTSDGSANVAHWNGADAPDLMSIAGVALPISVSC